MAEGENLMDEDVTKFLSEEMKFDEDGQKKFEELGIRTLSDFSEMDEADLNKLQLNKFEKRRFLKGLQRTVPNFIMQKPLTDVLNKMAKMQPAPEKRDEIYEWLSTARLEKYSKQLNRMGVKCVEDIALMEDEDMEELQLNKFEAQRFMKLLADLPNNTPAPISSSALNSTSQQAPSATGSSRAKSIAAAAMSDSSKRALATCAMPSQPSNTLELFYDNWRTVRSVNRK